MKKEQDTAVEFDFGFSFVDESEDTDPKHLHDTRVQLMLETITLFLDNLAKNPEKTTIHWPDRADKINQFKLRLEQIAKGNDE